MNAVRKLRYTRLEERLSWKEVRDHVSGAVRVGYAPGSSAPSYRVLVVHGGGSLRGVVFALEVRTSGVWLLAHGRVMPRRWATAEAAMQAAAKMEVDRVSENR